MSLDDFLRSHGIDPNKIEGHSGQSDAQSAMLRELVQAPLIRDVIEVGFNAGHSADAFLGANPKVHVTSFDIGRHAYAAVGKSYIDLTYPGRHRFVPGDSRETLPAFIKSFPNRKFDVIFIDGGHEYSVARSDFIYCSFLAHRDTIVVLDDTMWRPDWVRRWTQGPTKVWVEALAMNRVAELRRREFSAGRGTAYGRYLRTPALRRVGSSSKAALTLGAVRRFIRRPCSLIARPCVACLPRFG